MAKTTLLQQYLEKNPAALNDEQRLCGVIADALENDTKKIHALYFAYKSGIVEILHSDGILTDEQRERIRFRLVQDYAMIPETAKSAICYWERSLTVEIFREADYDKQQKEAKRLTAMLSVAAELPESSECIELCMVRQDQIHNGVTIQWKRRPDIQRYEIWRAERGGSAVCIAENRFPLPRYTDRDVEPSAKYAYAVRGWKSIDEQKRVDIISNDAEIYAPDADAPFQICEIKTDRTGITLRWSICFGAASYRVFKKSSQAPAWQMIDEFSSTISQYVDSEIRGERFYRVQCTMQDGSIQETREIRVWAKFSMG